MAATTAIQHELENLSPRQADALNELEVLPISTSPLLQWLDSKDHGDKIYFKDMNLSAYENYLENISTKSLGIEATKLMNSLMNVQSLVTSETVAHIKWKSIAEDLIHFIETSSFVSPDTILKDKSGGTVNVVKALCNKVLILQKDLDATKKVNEYLQEKAKELNANEVDVSRALVISNSINRALQNQISTMSNIERDIRVALQKGSNVKMNKRLAVLNDTVTSLTNQVELLRGVVSAKEAEIKELVEENLGMHALMSEAFELHSTVRRVANSNQKAASAEGVVAYGHLSSVKQIVKQQSKVGKGNLLISEEDCITGMLPIHSQINYIPVEGDEIDQKLATFMNARKNLIMFLPISSGIYIYGHRIVKLDLNEEYSSGISVNTGSLLYSLTNFVQEFEKDEFEFLDAIRTMSDKVAYENLFERQHALSKLQLEEGKAPTVATNLSKVISSEATTAMTFSLEDEDSVSELNEVEEETKIEEDGEKLFGDRALNIAMRSTQLYKGFPLKFDMNLADRVVHQVAVSDEVQNESKKKKKKRSSRYNVFADKHTPVIPLPEFAVTSLSKTETPNNDEQQPLELEGGDEEEETAVAVVERKTTTSRPVIHASSTKFPLTSRPSVISKNQIPFNAMKKSEIY